MFNNLIESSSHASEFKRRGSFVLFTSATYLLLFIVAGVISIYAYDARLDDPNTELVVMLSPVDFPAAPVPVKQDTPPPRSDTSRSADIIREAAMASVNHPEFVPVTTSAAPNMHLPVPDHGHYILGPYDSDPVQPGGTGRTGSGEVGTTGTGGAPHVDVGTPPPAQPPIHKPAQVVSKGVITGLALVLPKPPYPAIAKQAGAHGAVTVQVLVDETGKVISAKVISGHPLLVATAQQAAFGARFSPTKLGEQAVKVSGVITYNFVLQ
jgi:protein TonB